MTQTTLVFVAAVLLMVTDPVMAATVDSNRRAIARLEQRAASQTRFVTVRQTVRPAPPAIPESSGPSTLQASPAEKAWRDRYMQQRPWLLINRPQPGARRVRGGWIIHRDKARGEGFFQPLTADEANKR